MKKILSDILVMYTSHYGNPAINNDAFARLESKLTTLKGRKFYGMSFWDSDEYRACTQIQDDDNPELLGFKTAIIPGGLYAYKKLIGEYNEIVKQIPKTFAELKKEHDVDQSRPAVEFYRRHTEFIILLPIFS